MIHALLSIALCSALALGSASSGDLPPLAVSVSLPPQVWLVESIDSESVASGRAKTFKDSFVEMVSGSLQSRTLTDVDSAGMDKKEVM